MYAPAIDEMVTPWQLADLVSNLDTDLVIDEFDRWTLPEGDTPPCGPSWVSITGASDLR